MAEEIGANGNFGLAENLFLIPQRLRQQTSAALGLPLQPRTAATLAYRPPNQYVLHEAAPYMLDRRRGLIEAAIA